MSNQMFNIMSGAFFDRLCDHTSGEPVGSLYPEVLQGSMHNPLSAMRLMSMDVVQEISFDSKALAGAVGVPEEWFCSEHLSAPIDEVIPALGKMALIYLSSLRNAAMKYSFESDAKEDSLSAVATLAEVLQMNERLERGGTH